MAPESYPNPSPREDRMKIAHTLTIALTSATAIAGALSGPALQPAIVNPLPTIGWGTLGVMLTLGVLAPPLTLLILAAGAHYTAMARVWSGFYFLAVFLLAAGAGAIILPPGSALGDPTSLVFLAWGLGFMGILGLMKLHLLRTSARKASSPDD